MPAWNNDFPPYGLAHISASLREAGHTAEVLGLSRSALYERIKKHGITVRKPASG